MVLSDFSPVLRRQRRVDACEVYIMSSSRVKLYNGLSQDQKTKKKQKVARKRDVILVSTLRRGTNNVLQGHHTQLRVLT